MSRRPSPTPQYFIEEPVTGLYIHFGERASLAGTRAGATRFATVADAALTAHAYRITEQAHELVRVDA